MSADSVLYALMGSLSELSITREDVSADVSAGFLEVDTSNGSQFSWKPGESGNSVISDALTSRCLDGTHSVLFRKAPDAGPLQSVGISHPSLVLSTVSSDSTVALDESSLVFTPVDAPDTVIPVLGSTNHLVVSSDDLSRITALTEATGALDRAQSPAISLSEAQRSTRMHQLKSKSAAPASAESSADSLEVIQKLRADHQLDIERRHQAEARARALELKATASQVELLQLRQEVETKLEKFKLEHSGQVSEHTDKLTQQLQQSEERAAADQQQIAKLTALEGEWEP